MISLESAIALLTTYKYALLFPISVAEGPVISIIAGFLCAQGVLNIFITYGILVLGDIVGDVIYYSVGRWGGRPLIRKWKTFLGLNEEKVLKAEEHFKKHAKKTLIFGKTQAIGGAILAAAGLGKMPLLRFIWINFLASMVKSLALMVIGYYMGQTYTLIDHYLGLYAAITTIIVIIGIGTYWFIKHRKKYEKNCEKTGP